MEKGMWLSRFMTKKFMKGFIKAVILLTCTVGIIVLGKYMLTDQPYFDTKYDEFLHTDDEGIQIEAVDPQTVLDEMGFYTMEWAGIEEPYYLYLYIVDFEPYKYAMMYEPADIDGYTGEMSVYCSRIDDRIVFQFGEKRYAKAEKTVQTMSPIYVQNCYEQILEYLNTSGYSNLKWFEIKMEKGGATVGWKRTLDKTMDVILRLAGMRLKNGADWGTEDGAKTNCGYHMRVSACADNYGLPFRDFLSGRTVSCPSDGIYGCQ